MNVEQLIQLFQKEIDRNSALSATLAPLIEGLMRHADILRELPDDAWREIVARLQAGDEAHAMKAFVAALTPGEKIGMLSQVHDAYEAERLRIEERWDITKQIALAVAKNALGLLLSALLAKAGGKS